MQSEGNEVASPRPHARRQPPRQARNNTQRPHPSEALSDSNIPTAGTPKPRKNSRQQNYGDRTNSLAVSTSRSVNPGSQQRHRPASVAIAQPNPAATPSKPSYAGAAFHASPAPSSLPVPKFFSKSVPSANAESGLQAKLEREGDRSDSNEPGGHHLAPPPSRHGDKTPLDMFFSADRQEKARRQNGPSGSHTPVSRSATPNRSRDLFMLELDESSSPAASGHDTPTAARHSPRLSPENMRSANSDEASRAAQTQSLKSFLNITGAEAARTPPTHAPSPQQHHLFATPSHNHRQPDNSLLYSNRNLSPLFHAARTPPAAPPPSQQAFSPQTQNVGHYASVYANPYSPSPSTPHQSAGPYHGHPDNRFPPVHSPLATQVRPAAPPSGPSPQQSYGTDGTSDIKDMEDRMKRMLRMS